jgi:hypothetical protein
MTNQEIQALLPIGAQTRLAHQIGISKQAVSKALNGKMQGAKATRVIKEAELLAIQNGRVIRAGSERRRISEMTDDELLRWIDKRESVAEGSQCPTPNA